MVSTRVKTLGGKIYGEYNKGPVKVGGEWDFDEDLGEESIGSKLMTQGDRNTSMWL